MKKKISFKIKHKIAIKLAMYFSVTLLLFAIIIGIVFMLLFKNHTVKIQKADLEIRAITIAETLSSYFSEEQNSGESSVIRQPGLGAYLKFLDQIAMTDLWVVDEAFNVLISGNVSGQDASLSLPIDANSFVTKAFSGQTTFSDGFDKIFTTNTLTIGTPVKSNDKIVGALILRSSVGGMKDGVFQGLGILIISILVALSLSIFLSVLLAIAFTKPLEKIRNTAISLANGNYKAKTDVVLNDEIGELATTIDTLSDKLYFASLESENLARLRQDFVANISHELRTPITVIRASLEALFDEVITNPIQVKEYYRQMLSESIFLQRLVNDLLDLSRLQNTDFIIEMQPISLNDIIKDVLRSSQQLAKSKNIKVIVQNKPSENLDRKNTKTDILKSPGKELPVIDMCQNYDAKFDSYSSKKPSGIDTRQNDDTEIEPYSFKKSSGKDTPQSYETEIELNSEDVLGIAPNFEYLNDYMINGDYGRLRQMFMTILDNAIKFSSENSQIIITMSENSLSIRDNGVGISIDDLPYIFERFYKTKSAQNRDGTGLGLSIAKQIAQRHNIILTAKSSLGSGSEFTFVFM